MLQTTFVPNMFTLFEIDLGIPNSFKLKINELKAKDNAIKDVELDKTFFKKTTPNSLQFK